MKTFNNVVIVEQQRQPVAVGLVSMMILAGVCALALKYFWVLVAAAGLIYLAVRTYRSFLEAAQHQRELVAQADRQHQRFLKGDPRGFFGDDMWKGLSLNDYRNTHGGFYERFQQR